MVPGDGYVYLGAHELQGLGGIGPVAYDVAQAPRLIRAALGRQVGQDGLQGFQVAVEVGEDCDAHRR